MQLTLEGNIGGRPAHKPYEVIVSLETQSIQAQVSYFFWVSLAGCVETEGNPDMLVFKVSIDCLGYTNYGTGRFYFCHVFGQDAGEGVGAVSSHYNKAIQFIIF